MASNDSDGAVLARPVLLPGAVTDALHALEGEALEQEGALIAAFVDEQFRGDFAPREALRLRTALGALVQAIDARRARRLLQPQTALLASAGDGAPAASDAPEGDDEFESQLRAFEMDLQLVARSTARSVEQLLRQ